MKTNLALNLAVAVTAAAACLSIGSTAQAAGPQIVSGPSENAKCYVPWTTDTKFFKFPEKKGPYRVALANGYIANTWRIQMIQTAKAYAAQPEVAAKLKEFKVVSTGEDVAAQISAINNFIDSGYDAIVVNAQNPKAFAPVIKRAKDAKDSKATKDAQKAADQLEKDFLTKNADLIQRMNAAEAAKRIPRPAPAPKKSG